MSAKPNGGTAMDRHTSIFSLLKRNMEAYTISWVTTFFSSIVNVVWSVYVFHYDFVSNIDGALASQIGVVLLNELFLLYSVVASRKYLFGIGGPINTLWILLTAAFILLLIYAPMTAFKTYAMFAHVQIEGHSPLYDEINTYSATVFNFIDGMVNIDVPGLQAKYGGLIEKALAGLSGLVALVYLRSFFVRLKA